MGKVKLDYGNLLDLLCLPGVSLTLDLCEKIHKASKEYDRFWHLGNHVKIQLEDEECEQLIEALSDSIKEYSSVAEITRKSNLMNILGKPVPSLSNRLVHPGKAQGKGQ